MLKYDPEKPVLSWFRLILCLSIACFGTIAAVYLFWQIHWAVGVSVGYPISIFLVDIFIERKKSFLWYFCDFIRYILICAGTVVVVWFLWKIDWKLGVIVAIPIYILFVFFFGFLTAPFYSFTPEGWISLKATKKLKDYENTPNKKYLTNRNNIGN